MHCAGLDEPHLSVIQRQDHRTRSNAFPKKPYALQQISVRHARARKNHFLAGRQVLGVVDALRIRYAHFCQTFCVLRFAHHQPRQNLPVQATQRRRRQHAFRRAARAHHRMHSRPDDRGRNSRREVAVADQPDARPRRANIRDNLFVPRPVQNHHHEILNISLQPLCDRLQVVGHRSIQVDRPLARRPHHQLFHVQVRRMQQAAAVAGGQHGDSVCGSGRAEVGSFQRIHGDVHLRKQGLRRVRRQAHFFSDVQHWRFVPLAFANHDRAVDLHRVHRLAHRFYGHFIRVIPVAVSHRARRRNRGVFHHAQKIQAQLFFHFGAPPETAGVQKLRRRHLAGDFVLLSPSKRGRHHKPKRSFPSTLYSSLAASRRSESGGPPALAGRSPRDSATMLRGGPMSKSRRHFLTQTSLGLLGAAVAVRANAQAHASEFAQQPTQLPPGAPPAFGTGPAVGPEVSPATFAEAEKLVQVNLIPADRALAAGTWRVNLAAVYERRTGPRTIALEPTLAPFSRYHSVLPGQSAGPQHDQFIRTKSDPGPLPSNEADIAFAPVTQLSRWIEQRKLTSERLTRIYLKRIEQFDPRLRCVITLTRDLALAQAKKADEEIAAGKYRGPLHGIPWGGKDLLDTAGIPTTYGAEPFRNRIPKDDAAVVKRLHAAGAVLLAKLSLGALALNDIWFGGQTMNPWLLEEGASGSSAGPGAATAAALVGFSIGSETGGSIVSPSMRCGITGLRPTYGRVPRTGAMTLCWSLDKLGPMTRTVEDALLVLQTISGPDAGDISSVPTRLDFDATAPVAGLKVGYIPHWMKERPATDVDRSAMETIMKLKMELKEV